MRDALEIERVESHLNPPASYDLADHPVPTGREETWRFTPLKRLRGILDGEPSDACLAWETSLPEGVTMPVISSARRPGAGGAAAQRPCRPRSRSSAPAAAR